MILYGKLWVLKWVREPKIKLTSQHMHIYALQVPAEFFRIVLGPHLKYSCGLFRCAWELFLNVHFHKWFCRLFKLFLENVIAFWCLGHLPNISISRSSSATLTEAEEAMLEVYVERAQLKWAQNHKIYQNFFCKLFIVLDRDGMDLLDLGCGWGSVALFLAARYIF